MWIKFGIGFLIIEYLSLIPHWNLYADFSGPLNAKNKLLIGNYWEELVSSPFFQGHPVSFNVPLQHAYWSDNISQDSTAISISDFGSFWLVLYFC